MWNFPGGYVEDHETPEDSVYHEMKEETDLDLDE
jgi:ADP-ribose pyrophosphatase YjhB (NUDIX family)